MPVTYSISSKLLFILRAHAYHTKKIQLDLKKNYPPADHSLPVNKSAAGFCNDHDDCWLTHMGSIPDYVPEMLVLKLSIICMPGPDNPHLMKNQDTSPHCHHTFDIYPTKCKAPHHNIPTAERPQSIYTKTSTQTPSNNSDHCSKQELKGGAPNKNTSSKSKASCSNTCSACGSVATCTAMQYASSGMQYASSGMQ